MILRIDCRSTGTCPGAAFGRLLVLVVTVLVPELSVAEDSTPVPPARPLEVHGHRGARARFPENTLPAFRHALEVAADVLEMDVVATADDQLVVVHDLALDPEICLGPDGKPPVGEVPVRALPLEKLRQYDCGAVRNPKFPGQTPIPGTRVPTLREVFGLVRDSKLPAAAAIRFNIELKGVPARPELNAPLPELTALLVAVVREFGLEDRTIVQSFDHEVLLAVRRLEPRIRIAALLAQNRPDLAALAGNLKPDVLVPNWEWITATDVVRLHELGVKVIPWTANDPAAWSALLRLGVDGIITDDPEALLRFLGR
jgi:glycerophosphoryl diester phosphodiesterase